MRLLSLLGQFKNAACTLSWISVADNQSHKFLSYPHFSQNIPCCCALLQSMKANWFSKLVYESTRSGAHIRSLCPYAWQWNAKRTRCILWTPKTSSARVSASCSHNYSAERTLQPEAAACGTSPSNALLNTVRHFSTHPSLSNRKPSFSLAFQPFLTPYPYISTSLPMDHHSHYLAKWSLHHHQRRVLVTWTNIFNDYDKGCVDFKQLPLALKHLPLALFQASSTALMWVWEGSIKPKRL